MGGLAAAAKRESRGGSGPFLHISATPHRRQKLQNASSNSLWVLERTHCALGGRPLRGSCSSAAAAGEPQQAGSPAAWPTSSSASKSGGGNSSIGGSAHHNQHSAASPRISSSHAGSAAPASPYPSSGGGGGSGTTERRRRRHSDADAMAGSDGGGRGSGGGGASGAQPSPFFAAGGGGRDTYAEAVAKRRKRQGAGDAVEHVRIKHLATMRYLCVGRKCDPVEGGADTVASAAPSGTAGTRRRGDSRKKGAEAQEAAATRVGMLTVEQHAAVPAATVFVIRPRTTQPSEAGGGQGAADRWLGPHDLVHLQHKDTGLFLSALPLDEVGGGNLGLTMVKSPLTTEVRFSCLRFV